MRYFTINPLLLPF